MTLNETLSFIEVGDRHILLSDKNSNEYYYNDIYQFEDSGDYEKLSPLEVISVDVSNTVHVTFYLW